MVYPFTFQPRFKERVWGGHKLEELYGKELPPGVPIGESWEISDRPGDVSVITNGPLAGKDLRWLMEHHADELLGKTRPLAGRFPFLVKILDAQDKLSLQVHPPAQVAAQLDGEPKTEMWYIAEAAPGAELYVGLRRGVTRQDFETKLRSGEVDECLHRVSVRAGDVMFLPSGRVHAIGAGLVIFEIQQNSDTTYRVFDWNRVDLDGRPRALHLKESLASIDFADFEPALADYRESRIGSAKTRLLVRDPLFLVERVVLDANQSVSLAASKLRILGILDGRPKVVGGATSVDVGKGQFCLVPASLDAEVLAGQEATFLLVQPGE